MALSSPESSLDAFISCPRIAPNGIPLRRISSALSLKMSGSVQAQTLHLFIKRGPIYSQLIGSRIAIPRVGLKDFQYDLAFRPFQGFLQSSPTRWPDSNGLALRTMNRQIVDLNIGSLPQQNTTLNHVFAIHARCLANDIAALLPEFGPRILQPSLPVSATTRSKKC